MEDLDALLTLAGEQAHRVLIEMRQPNLTAMYMLLGPKEARCIVCLWADDAEKRAVLAEVKNVAADIGATRLSFVSQVWMTDTREASDALMIRPSEHPKRREFVIAAATDGRETKIRRWQIIRGKPGGSIITLLPDPMTDDAVFSGRMVDGILPARAAP